MEDKEVKFGDLKVGEYFRFKNARRIFLKLEPIQLDKKIHCNAIAITLNHYSTGRPNIKNLIYSMHDNLTMVVRATLGEVVDDINESYGKV